jgi:membrane protein DedA with SNARE-associated domain
LYTLPAQYILTLEDGMEEFIKSLAHLTEPQFLEAHRQYLLGFVFLYSFMEVVFPPMPGDALLVFSASLAGRAGIHPLWVVLSASAGAFFASMILFYLGTRMERRMLDSPRGSVLIDSKGFAKVEAWFIRYGFGTILLSRFVPVVRSGIILAAGVVRMEPRRSLIAVALSIICFNSLLVFGSKLLGRGWHRFVELWESNTEAAILITIGLFGLGFLVFWVFTRMKKAYLKRKKTDGE